MPIDKYLFGQKIKAARLSRNMSQTLLAEQIGVAPSTIAMYETGQRFPVLENLDALADALNLPMSYFLEDAPAADHQLDSDFPRFLAGNQSDNEQQLLAFYRSMNSLGQEEVTRYADYCATKPEYQKNTQSEAE